MKFGSNQLENEFSCHQDNQEEIVTKTLLASFADFSNARAGRAFGIQLHQRFSN